MSPSEVSQQLIGQAGQSAPLIDARALAEHLGVPLGHVRRLSAAGRIPRIKIGYRTIRYDLDAVLAALAAGDTGNDEAGSSSPCSTGPQ